MRGKPCRGVSLTIYLPRVEEPACTDIADTESPEAFEGTETILVAEDEPGVRSPVHDSMRLESYMALGTGNGTEALTLAQRHAGPIHLLLTDVIKPQINGRELSEGLKAGRPGRRVLFISGYTDDAVPGTVSSLRMCYSFSNPSPLPLWRSDAHHEPEPVRAISTRRS